MGTSIKNEEPAEAPVLLQASPVMTEEQARKLPKIISHEHLDCSVRPSRIVEYGTELDTGIPEQFKTAWKAATSAEDKAQVAADYQRWVQAFASGSLDNYLHAIVNHILPVMQTQDALYQITKDRIEDAAADGIIAMKLRFAPQLHRRNGLTLQQVIDPVQRAVSEAPFPVRLIICSLRHENGRLGWHLANAVIRNPLVSSYDLAGSETMFPGVLPWWKRQAKRVNEAGKQVTCHIGETNAITDQDLADLDEIGCTELGHAIKGNPGRKLCTCCVTSNIVTHQVANAQTHPIDEMYDDGKKVTIDIDGTTFTGTTGSGEYCLLANTFGWGNEHFLRCNLNALEHFPADVETLRQLEAVIRAAYTS